MGLQELLARPVVALLSGALLGIALLLPVAWGTKFLSTDQFDFGLIVAAGSVLVGSLVALGALFVYRAVSPDGLIWFGPALVGGFILALGVFAVRVAMSFLKSDDDARR